MLISMSYYCLFVVVILPLILNGLFNALIYLRVRSSTLRVRAVRMIQNPAVKSTSQHTRDIYLLKHMLFNFIIFMVGWAPIYVVGVADSRRRVPVQIYELLKILPAFSSLINVLDLFWYSHDVRQYLRERLPICRH